MSSSIPPLPPGNQIPHKAPKPRKPIPRIDPPLDHIKRKIVQPTRTPHRHRQQKCALQRGAIRQDQPTCRAASNQKHHRLHAVQQWNMRPTLLHNLPPSPFFDLHTEELACKIHRMISILHEKDYELLGDVEIRCEDWQRIRKLGAVRFATQYCRATLGVRLGGLLLLTTAASLHNLHEISTDLWIFLAYFLFALVAGLVHAARAWLRLERRFNRDAPQGP